MWCLLLWNCGLGVAYTQDSFWRHSHWSRVIQGGSNGQKGQYLLLAGFTVFFHLHYFLLLFVEIQSHSQIFVHKEWDWRVERIWEWDWRWSNISGGKCIIYFATAASDSRGLFASPCYNAEKVLGSQFNCKHCEKQLYFSSSQEIMLYVFSICFVIARHICMLPFPTSGWLFEEHIQKT